jgi:hypothetical protein
MLLARLFDTKRKLRHAHPACGSSRMDLKARWEASALCEKDLVARLLKVEDSGRGDRFFG